MTQEIAMKLCELEGLKEQVNIAQMNEIVAKLPQMVAELPLEEMVDFFKFLMKKKYLPGRVKLTIEI